MNTPHAASHSSPALVSDQPSPFLSRCMAKALAFTSKHGRPTGELRPLGMPSAPHREAPVSFAALWKATVSGSAPLVPGSASDPGKPGLDSALVQRLRASLFGSGQVAVSPSIVSSAPVRTALPVEVSKIGEELAKLDAAAAVEKDRAEIYRIEEQRSAVEAGTRFVSPADRRAELAKLEAAAAVEKDPKELYRIEEQRSAVEDGARFVSPAERRAELAKLEAQLGATTCPRERYVIAQRISEYL